MSNQPPARPLFRIGSLAPPAPAPTRAPAPRMQSEPTPSPPPPQTRPAFRPLFTQTFRPYASQPAHEAPPGPQAPNTAAPSAPTTTAQPPPQPVAPSLRPIAAAAPPMRPRAAVPAPPPPRDVVPPLPPPPSSVSLTPQHSNAESRLPHEDEKKTVLVKEMIEKARPNHKDDKGEVMESHNAKQMKQKVGHKMYSSNKEETSSSMKIITIAGENKGAFMKLGYSTKKQVGRHAMDPETEPAPDEGRSRVMKNEGHEVLGNGSLPRQPMYLNSNVQGVNNSILYNCSRSYNDPGVHYSYSRMSLNGQGIHHKNMGLNKPIQKRGNSKEKIAGRKENGKNDAPDLLVM